MSPGYELKTKDKEEKQPEPEDIKYPPEQAPTKTSIPMIAGIFLIVAGILAMLSWIQVLMIDVTAIESMIDISQIQEMYPDITPEMIAGFLSTCAIIGCVISVFPILGGILAIKRKLWGIPLACSIIGLFTIGILFSSSGLSLIALILLIISRKEFQQRVQ
jgi:hypothetical protein